MTENRQYLEGIMEELIQHYYGFINDEGEEVGIYDYLVENTLDVRYVIESNFEYRSCEIFVTLGGPTVWIDTETSTLQLRWGSEKEELYIGKEITEEIDTIQEEYYNCR
jgi:hypothetical protein